MDGGVRGYGEGVEAERGKLSMSEVGDKVSLRSWKSGKEVEGRAEGELELLGGKLEAYLLLSLLQDPQF